MSDQKLRDSLRRGERDESFNYCCLSITKAVMGGYSPKYIHGNCTPAASAFLTSAKNFGPFRAWIISADRLDRKCSLST